MIIGGAWNKLTTWIFHIGNKDIFRAIADGEKGIDYISKIKIEKEWYPQTEQEAPVNYKFLLDIIQAYHEYLYVDKKVAIPYRYKIILNKSIQWAIVMIANDIFYTMRFFGCIYCIIYNEEKFRVVTERKQSFIDLQEWCLENDWRVRSKNWIKWIFNFFISRYEKEIFITKSLDFIVDWILNHKEEFVYSNLWNPEYWYPRGMGRLNWYLYGEDDEV